MKTIVSFAACVIALSGCGANPQFFGKSGFFESGIPLETSSKNDTRTSDQKPSESDARVDQSKAEVAENSGGSMECGGALSASPDQVISISQDDPDIASKLKDGSVVLLRIVGQADVSLVSSQISKLKGLCIWSSGGSSISLTADFQIQNLVYFGRGKASSTINFLGAGRLDAIDLDIAGAHKLNLQGQSLDCSRLLSGEAGASQVQCGV